MPYRRLIADGLADMVMPGHLYLEALSDPDSRLPTSLSKGALACCATTSASTGVIISDDMEMQAIEADYGLEEAAVAAVLAGNNILIYSNYAHQRPDLPRGDHRHPQAPRGAGSGASRPHRGTPTEGSWRSRPGCLPRRPRFAGRRRPRLTVRQRPVAPGSGHRQAGSIATRRAGMAATAWTSPMPSGNCPSWWSGLSPIGRRGAAVRRLRC